MKKLFTVFCALISALIVGTVKAANYSSYEIGDIIAFEQQQYIVVEDSTADSDSVLILRMKPLTFAEIKSTGIEVNNYISSDNSGKIAFYTSETCSSDSNKIGCSQLYADSTVKKVLDKWAESLSSSTGNSLISLGSTNNSIVRLIYVTDLNNISEKKGLTGQVAPLKLIFGDDSDIYGWFGSIGTFNAFSTDRGAIGLNVYQTAYVVPVIRIHKGALSSTSTSASVNDKNINSDNSGTANGATPTSGTKTSDKVGVENTLLSKSIIPIIVGLFLVGVGITIYTLTVKKKR